MNFYSATKLFCFNIGLAKKLFGIFHNILQKNLNKFFGQPSFSCTNSVPRTTPGAGDAKVSETTVGGLGPMELTILTQGRVPDSAALTVPAFALVERGFLERPLVGSTHVEGVS